MDLTPTPAEHGYQCEAIDPRHGDCCGAPATVCDLDAPSSLDMNAPPRFLCAHHARRAELDQELKALGAHVIRVKDLGAALRAAAYGQTLMGSMTEALIRIDYDRYVAREIAWHASQAAHLARVALGEPS